MTNLSEKIKKSIQPYLDIEEWFDTTLNINWSSITEGFIKYTDDPNHLIHEIKKLGFKDTDEIILKLPVLHETILDELAEEFINDDESEIINEFVNAKNPLFEEKTRFYQLLKNVITKLERERIILELPNSYNKLALNTSEKNIELAFKNKGREDLKNKFNKWDKELKEEKGLTKPRGKIAALSWIKFTVAASLVLGVGFSIFSLYNNFNQEYDIADLIVVKDNATIVSNSGEGYTFSSSPSSKKEITINYVDQSAKIASLEKVINDNVGTNIDHYKKELDDLIFRENKYTFIDNEFTFYHKKFKELLLIELEKKYLYIKFNASFYRIKKTTEPLTLIKETDKDIISKLEKILSFKL